MKREARIRRRSEFQRIYRQGRTYANRVAVLHVLKETGDGPRVAVAAGRKLGTAVVRNRAKRRLREAIQRLWSGVAPGTRLVVIARTGAMEAPFETVVLKMEELLERAGVAVRDQEGEH